LPSNTKARYQSGLFSKAYLPDENKFIVTGVAGWIRVPVKKSREYALEYSLKEIIL
jgi:hypothetical protein